MQQHSVPQNITGFEFKLIGFLTLKEFGYLAATAIICFMIYLIFSGIFRWIFIVPIASFGIALSLGEIAGMKFDKWLISFIRAVTSPTQRVWRKETKTIGFLEPQFAHYLRRPAAKTAVPPDRKRLKAFLTNISTGGSPRGRLDAIEKTRLSELNFGQEESFVYGAGDSNSNPREEVPSLSGEVKNG
jgi:hypothetical protein